MLAQIRRLTADMDAVDDKYADLRYERLLLIEQAREVGVSNPHIAREIGVTDAAVGNWLAKLANERGNGNGKH